MDEKDGQSYDENIKKLMSSLLDEMLSQQRDKWNAEFNEKIDALLTEIPSLDLDKAFIINYLASGFDLGEDCSTVDDLVSGVLESVRAQNAKKLDLDPHTSWDEIAYRLFALEKARVDLADTEVLQQVIDSLN